MQYFPGNTVSHYTTQLPRNLKFIGEWVVALVEIQFPRTFLHIDSPNPPFGLTPVITAKVIPRKKYRSTIKKSDNEKPSSQQDQIPSEVATEKPKRKLEPILPKTRNIIIPGGVYKSVKSLVEIINESPELKGHIDFVYNEEAGGLVVIRRYLDICTPNECGRYHVLELNDKLSTIFGFPLGKPIDMHNEWTVPAEYPANLSLAFPDKLFVYSDICESYITGDVQTPLLRIVPVDYTNYIYGSTQTKSFSPPIYIPLQRTEFNTIEIDIRTDTGKPVPFESGPLTVILHFKRIG